MTGSVVLQTMSDKHRLLACGGRDYDDVAFLFRTLDDLHREHQFRDFMQGGARGADALAKDWAKTHPDIERWEFKADWQRHGPAAGPIRNQRMLHWGPDVVVAFAGGKGTADMVRRARAAGVEVIEA
jgi:hypothetical protein